MTDSQPTDEADDGVADDGVSRRWLIRLLVGLGIGIPVLVEAVTFLELLRSRLFGDGDDGANPTPTPTPTAGSAVGVGDELLAATTPTETLREAFIRVREASWELVLVVEVDNTTETPYELRLGDVRTTGGETVAGGAGTGRIQPGASATVTGRWTLPRNEQPETLAVTALSFAGDTQVTERQVELARVSLRG